MASIAVAFSLQHALRRHQRAAPSIFDSYCTVFGFGQRRRGDPGYGLESLQRISVSPSRDEWPLPHMVHEDVTL